MFVVVSTFLPLAGILTIVAVDEAPVKLRKELDFMTDQVQADVHKRLYRTVSISCGRHLNDPLSREECALEFVEHVLVFLSEEKRQVLLAEENERLLHRVACCFVLNWKQQTMRRRSRSTCFTELPEYNLSKLASSGNELFAETLLALLSDLLRFHLSKLPTKQRHCAVLRWIKDRSVEEIASELQLSATAVRKNLQYARDKLRVGLREMGYDERDV